MDSPQLPFFSWLERRGLTLTQAEEAVGIGGISAAVRRCAYCGEQHACRTQIASGGLASSPVNCPNAMLFERLR